MKATVGRRQPVGKTMPASADSPHPVDQGHASFASSVVLSVVLHGVLILWMFGSAWLLGRAQPYRLTPQTVYLAGDSPIALDQVPGEGGGVAGTKPESKGPGGVSKAAQVESGAEPSVEKFAPPVEKPVLPPPKPVTEKTVSTPPPKPVVEKTVPPPPKPVVEKPIPPTPVPKPAVEKEVPTPPEAMTLAQKQKETKPITPPVSLPPTSKEVQQKAAKLRERQTEQAIAETRAATEVQQKVAQLREQQVKQERAEQALEQRVGGLRAEQADKQALEQRVAALRTRVGSGGSEEGNSSVGGSGSGSGTAGTGRGSSTPGGGRGTGTAGAGGVGTGGLSGIRLRNYQAELQAKIKDAWSIPPGTKGLQAVFLLSINRAGQVEQARLVRGSGNMLFDESLQRAIKQAQPLPPLPEDFTDRTLEVTLPFRDTRQ